MSMLVKVADASENDKSSVDRGLGLNEEEMLGNLFVFTSAGFDVSLGLASLPCCRLL